MSVLLIDNSVTTLYRMRELFEVHNIDVYDARNIKEANKIMSRHYGDIKLVIIDIDIDTKNIFSLIERLLNKQPSLPIVVLTPLNDREYFVRAMELGVRDYILKPFVDNLFWERISNLMEMKNGFEKIKVELELGSYIDGELRRAEKGEYGVSIMITTLLRDSGEDEANKEQEFLNRSIKMYDEFKALFWVTDLFTYYGTQSFIGVFPFCDKKNSEIIHAKMTEKFENLKKNDADFDEHHMEISWITFPDDGRDRMELMKRLRQIQKENMEKEIERLNIVKDILFDEFD